MVAFSDDFGENPKTLCDWVKNFRIKKIQMKRKFRGGGDLRVCAILSTALLNAEHELRRKQQERFNRWLDMQAKLEANKRSELTTTSFHHHHHHQQIVDNELDFGETATATVNADCYAQSNMYINVANEERQRRDEITDLWKYELSGLDEFMRNISTGNCNNNNNDISNSTCTLSNISSSSNNNHHNTNINFTSNNSSYSSGGSAIRVAS